ncbi:MAG: nucleotide exchange factor GrpE [Planctomycetes bacterium]|nr:nucleotide exchange factor GrpE [Planctomycetota bacterium]
MSDENLDNAPQGEEQPQAGEEPQQAPAGPEEAIVTLESLAAERDDLLARLQRVSADFVNYQKRMERERMEIRGFIVADVLSAMFDVMDDLELAVSHARENHPADDPLLTGTEMVYRKALGVFERFGVTPIDAAGRAFDPSVHEAVVSQPTDEAPPMTVLAEIRKGYRLRDRVIRPSRVVVAAALPDEDNGPREQPGEEGNDHADV